MLFCAKFWHGNVRSIKLLLAFVKGQSPKGGAKMRKYEIMFIVKPTLDEAAIKKVADDVKATFEKFNSNVLEVKDMGQRDLAYEIKKHKKGYYFLFTVEATVDAIDEFNHIVNISENIIRALVVKLED